jgi:site-specific recombinase XerD
MAKKIPPQSTALVPTAIDFEPAALGRPLRTEHREDPRSAFERQARAVVAAKRTEGTRVSYTNQLTKWLAYVDVAGIDSMRASLASAADFRDQLAAGGLQGPSVGTCLAVLSSIYGALKGQGTVQHNPFNAHVLGHPDSAPAQPASYVAEADYERMLAYARTLPSYHTSCRWQAVIQLAWLTGLRRTELAELTVESLFSEDDVPRLRVLMKGKKEREVPISPEALAVIEAFRWCMCVSAGRLFLGATGPSIYQLFKRCAQRAGVIARIHPHGFRATMITDALDYAGPHEVGGLVGHASVDTTMRYDRKHKSRGVHAMQLLAEARRKKTNPKDDGGT